LKELQTTAQNLSKITDQNSQLNMALAQMRTFAENLTSMTASDSPLQLALKNAQSLTDNLNKVTTDLTSNDNINVTLANFRESSEKLKSAINDVAPDLRETGTNVKDLTDTVKRQPWRLVWPSTKEYPNDRPAGETITVRKSTRSQRGSNAAPARRRHRAARPDLHGRVKPTQPPQFSPPRAAPAGTS
jgi:small-conductance mechanosensitive channel